MGTQSGQRRCVATVWSRTAALVAVTMAASLAGSLAGSRLAGAEVPRYDAVIVGVAVVLTSLAGVKMWVDNCFESRLAAVVVALLVAAGELLSATVGGPGGDAGSSYPSGLFVGVLALVVPVLVGADARARARSVTEDAPYAL